MFFKSLFEKIYIFLWLLKRGGVDANQEGVQIPDSLIESLNLVFYMDEKKVHFNGLFPIDFKSRWVLFSFLKRFLLRRKKTRRATDDKNSLKLFCTCITYCRNQQNGINTGHKQCHSAASQNPQRQINDLICKLNRINQPNYI